MTTTARYRTEAATAEKARDWAHAAYCWACAIEAYPAGRGALALKDLARMTARRDAARRETVKQSPAGAPGPEHY